MGLGVVSMDPSWLLFTDKDFDDNSSHRTCPQGHVAVQGSSVLTGWGGRHCFASPVLGHHVFPHSAARSGVSLFTTFSETSSTWVWSFIKKKKNSG